MKVRIPSRGLFPGGGRDIELTPASERLIGWAGRVFDGMDNPKIEPSQLQAETELFELLADAFFDALPRAHPGWDRLARKNLAQLRADDSALFAVVLGAWLGASFEALALAGVGTSGPTT
jgi:hypothetical protein